MSVAELERTPIDLEAKLIEHWLMDTTTANQLASFSSSEGHEYLETLYANVESIPDAVQRRDENRKEVQKIFSGESDKKLIILGPCSLDEETDYTELFDFIEQLQTENPNVVFGVRLNGAKPRSRGGDTGLFLNTKPGQRRKQLDIFDEALRRGLAIFTEVTDKDQFGVLAPYLTGVWLGARDMASTDLRTLLSSTRMNTMVKTAVDGRLASLEDAVAAIGKSTEENDGSGVNLGHIAATCRHDDGGPYAFTTAEGNKNVAIIARGYEIDKEEIDEIGTIRLVNELSEQARDELAYKHLGDVCTLAVKLGCVALLDGSHKVPHMMSFEKTDEQRFLKVLKKFRAAVLERKIRNVSRIRGYLGEVSVNYGKTDKNAVLDNETKQGLREEVVAFDELETAQVA